MTVLVRPVPKRAGSNGIRPFVRPPVNNIRPYTVKNWRPPVPEPLSPAPLLGPKELLGLGLLVFVQIWGWLASRPKSKIPADGAQGGNVTGTMPPPGNTVGGTLTVDRTAGNYSSYNVADCSQSTNGAVGAYRVLTVASVKAVELVQAAGNCGKRSFTWRYTLTNGTVQESTSESVTYGYKSVGFGHTVNWAGDGAIPWQTPTQTLPLPGGYQPPEVEPETEVKPGVLPPAPRLPVPVLPPVPAPETRPEIAPVEPGPSRPPTTTPRPPVFRPIRPVSPTGTKDGAIVPKPADPVVVTDPDWHFPIPGKGPITGNGPRPTPEEMAKELGRLEQKLNSILNPTPDTPMEWQNWLEQIREALFNLVNGKTYTLTEDCNPDNDPNYTPRSWDFNAPGALNAFGVIENRLDALAAMIGQSLRAKQQVCLPTGQEPVGINYSVQFRSVVVSPNGEKRLRKELRYRDQGDAGLVAHRDHWLGFEWTSGPWMVISTGLPWGKPRVWASSPEEGKRVLAHAAQISGVNLQDPKHRWVVREVQNGRYGPQIRMVVHRDTRGVPWITTRDGSNGLPLAAP